MKVRFLQGMLPRAQRQRKNGLMCCWRADAQQWSVPSGSAGDAGPPPFLVARQCPRCQNTMPMSCVDACCRAECFLAAHADPAVRQSTSSSTS
eukprot:1755550-Rhodomonas_salina.1